MSSEEKGIKVRILDKEFRVSCTQEAQPALYEAASYLDNQMRQIRQSGRVIGAERIAIMAALNLSHEILALKQKSSDEDVEILRDRLQALQQKIDGAISSQGQAYDRMKDESDASAKLEHSRNFEEATEY